jgi:pimeloyl-ACP methyl ester carboxylesterase
MLTIFKGILFLLVLAAVLHWMTKLWRRVYSFEPGFRQIHLVSTQDGWLTGLFRYPPECKRHESPVILCHGLGANRCNFDLGREKSLARYLQSEGFDVWVLELRDRGLAARIGKRSDRYRSPYVFDDYVKYDAPAALSHVCSETGATRVHWVGHSMGGLILYGLLQGGRAAEIASGVAVASPGDFHNVRRIPMLFPLWRLARYLPRIHQRFLASVFAPVVPWLPSSFQALVFNPRNTEKKLIQRAVCHLICDVSRGEMLQFYDCMRNQEFRSFDGEHSYAKGFAYMKGPLLLLAGTRDPLCPPESIGFVYRSMQSDQKELRIFGKEHGQLEEYGHGDLLIGKHCETEVYPHILRWLETSDGTPTGGGENKAGPENRDLGQSRS